MIYLNKKKYTYSIRFFFFNIYLAWPPSNRRSSIVFSLFSFQFYCNIVENAVTMFQGWISPHYRGWLRVGTSPARVSASLHLSTVSVTHTTQVVRCLTLDFTLSSDDSLSLYRSLILEGMPLLGSSKDV